MPERMPAHSLRAILSGLLLASLLCGLVVLPPAVLAQIAPSPTVPLPTSIASTSMPGATPATTGPTASALPEPPGSGDTSATPETTPTDPPDDLADDYPAPDDGVDDWPTEDLPDETGDWDDPGQWDEPTNTPAPTPRLDERPDGAEPNNTREQARPLALDGVAGPFTFLPEGDVDWYSVDLGTTATNLPLDISVYGSGELDLVTTLYRADLWTPLAIISSPALSTTLAGDVTGWLVLKVENRGLADTLGQSYRVEIRRTLPAPPTPLPATSQRPVLLPDSLENNWNFATAAAIGVGATYDLNFACPEAIPSACPGGDHDYLRFTAKAGLRYLLTTYDLAPGVDTVMSLYYGSEEQPIATSDDERPGGGFLSTLRWLAPGDGEAVVRIGPRTGGQQIVTFGEAPASYRFAIVLADTPLARELEARVAEQTHAPTPTPTLTATATPFSPADEPYAPPDDLPADVGPNEETSSPAQPMPVPADPAPGPGGETRVGRAIVVVTETLLRTEPRDDAEVLEQLPAETLVTLLGPVRGAWVRVETDQGVVPGWIYGPHLRRPTTATPTPAAEPLIPRDPTDTPGVVSPPGPTTSPDTPPGSDPSSTATPAQAVPALELDPLPDQDILPLPQRVPLVVTVTLVAQTTAPPPPPGPGQLTPTPGTQTPLVGVRVQLVSVFGDLFTTAVTDGRGTVVLARDLLPGTQVRVRIPAAGLELPVDPSQPVLRIGIPTGGLR